MIMECDYGYETESSRELFERALKVLVEGVSSPSRSTANYKPYPIFMKRGKGSKIYDVDGNEYIDFMMAYGALSLGHAHPKIVETVKRVVEDGSLFATASEIEVEVAEMMCQIIPCAEKVRFANTGTEAVMAAIRLARGYTGRKKIIKFEGAYHGWYDDVLINSHPQRPDALGYYNDPIKIPDSSGIPQEAFENTVLVPWNNASILEKKVKEHKNEIAAVITEPILANMGVIPPKEGYLKAIREITEENDILLILDEVVTGFRIGLGGCQEYYRITPDLATYGKAFGAGYPIAAFAGRSEIMEALKWGGVLHYGTQNAGNLGLSIVKANIEVLSEDGVYERIFELGNFMMNGIRERLAKSNIMGIVQGVGPMFQIFFTDNSEITDYREYCAYVNRELYRKFVYELFKRGVYTTPSAALHSVVSLAHTKEDIDKALLAVEGALKAISES
jgi:glutamate-1-semialdehyde 2,1-aminomutase